MAQCGQMHSPEDGGVAHGHPTVHRCVHALLRELLRAPLCGCTQQRKTRIVPLGTSLSLAGKLLSASQPRRSATLRSSATRMSLLLASASKRHSMPTARTRRAPGSESHLCRCRPVRQAAALAPAAGAATLATHFAQHVGQEGSPYTDAHSCIPVRPCGQGSDLHPMLLHACHV